MTATEIYHDYAESIMIDKLKDGRYRLEVFIDDRLASEIILTTYQLELVAKGLALYVNRERQMDPITGAGGAVESMENFGHVLKKLKESGVM